jgi:hypothetical protein
MGTVLGGGPMRERAKYLEILQRRVEQGSLSAAEMVQAMIAYDSARATARNTRHTLLSVTFAAVAAIASAVAVFLAALSAWRP